jgi:hypothetical protein
MMRAVLSLAAMALMSTSTNAQTVNYDIFPGGTEVHGSGPDPYQVNLAIVLDFKNNRGWNCNATHFYGSNDPRLVAHCNLSDFNGPALAGTGVKTTIGLGGRPAAKPDGFWQINQITGEARFCEFGPPSGKSYSCIPLTLP